jgi:hypothetical protein
MGLDGMWGWWRDVMGGLEVGEDGGRRAPL